MLKKLRKNSKQLLETRRSSITNTPKAAATSPKPGKLTFFDLPAEIRNVIYEYVASGTSIFIPSVRKKATEPVPCMLQASRQIKGEFLPIMLEFAEVSVKIKDFDFGNLMRVSGSLYSTEQKALRNNKRLRLHLVADRCSKDSMRNLRKWLFDRAAGVDRLDWHYAIAWPKNAQMPRAISDQVQVTNANIQRWSALDQNLKMMGGLSDMLNDNLRYELQPIVAAFEREKEGMGNDPHESWSAVGSWTASYGVRMRNQTSCSNWG